jgi:hypothetical protein
MLRVAMLLSGIQTLLAVEVSRASAAVAVSDQTVMIQHRVVSMHLCNRRLARYTYIQRWEKHDSVNRTKHDRDNEPKATIEGSSDTQLAVGFSR